VRVLIVEDDKKVAGVVRRGLESEGFGVDIALNGPDGLWMASEGSYDVIVLDIMLPGMNGFKVCEKLREEPFPGVFRDRFGRCRGHVRKPPRLSTWTSPGYSASPLYLRCNGFTTGYSATGLHTPKTGRSTALPEQRSRWRMPSSPRGRRSLGGQLGGNPMNARNQVKAVLVTAALAGVVVPFTLASDASAAKPKPVKVKLQEFKVRPKPKTVNSGDVTFKVKNVGTIDHEFVVVRTDGEALPTAPDGSVDEEQIAAAAQIGEVEDLGPKDSGKLEATGLEPGTYTLFCNVVDDSDDPPLVHYGQGMYTTFVVE
jgi:uncharacterized cupredoxin-like copper-binding protein